MKIRVLIFLYLCAFLGITSISSQARMFVRTGTDVGRITAISADHSVTLDNNHTYIPVRNGIKINNLHAGDRVSIYYTTGEKGRMYFEVKRATKNAMSRPLSQPREKVRRTLK